MQTSSHSSRAASLHVTAVDMMTSNSSSTSTCLMRSVGLLVCFADYGRTSSMRV